MDETQTFIAIVPAAGVGKRMQANCPKQYLKINEQTILYHTVSKLLSHSCITQVIIALGENDQYFNDSGLVDNKNILRVTGGKERVDSVLSGLKAINSIKNPWVLVHDAARPCVSLTDIDKLIQTCRQHNSGGILATPVRDTMKRGHLLNADISTINNTVEREQLWHALTPQLYKTDELTSAIEKGLKEGWNITDEASAIELANLPSLLVPGSSENIKITNPDDLALAEFYLNKQAAK
ncbi:2-C-methyl-D-erythritol 4-phosphate cytidylyltransferase [Colwellia sp. E2M01]|uniref:2-C-methyl-D-erythritol 4-phosphate cytidylyltransferase n=1 Tax=Colwellia sp. E2M01 TaxID=2841561 RepID=UPI001C083B0B|nr:2-C-methyl-D-erythritol 4-phosphate cytidylyltransferase [Colwellia sp. E2M01]MBU2869257.1 2-C-methyl-D-erythritol 4-phosphate cytidylyltransferase [Colwellia sp. E2M01]